MTITLIGIALGCATAVLVHWAKERRLRAIEKRLQRLEECAGFNKQGIITHPTGE